MAKEPQEIEPVEGDTEPQTQEPTEKSDSEKIKDVDPEAEIPSETQQAKRHKEQLAGQQKGFEKILERMDTQDEKIAQVSKQPESPPEPVSDADKTYADYFDKLGYIRESDVDKMVQERIAPLTKGQKESQEAEQRTIINDFVKIHPEFSKEEDPTGDKMGKVIEKLRRIAPVVQGNPNYSLKDDLEHAYEWEFGKGDLEEFRQKAKASGATAALEALETQVGGGSSVTPPRKKVRSSEQEQLLKDWGVDDETQQNKKNSKKGS